ncbi:1,5-anhydro-D-fructose reductase [Rubripirellula lacrimiformis]|uniref:1,5-anhydro-D-fructose reductase n=1 Tax=Rubripirellula lacrimiformis TaxID=1930273 RepID=A0A517N724_9BACT|nr:Gfo/Idh/MocA family oxidoreductase [Rubripirellula lacrimiformis]QDT02943.1 1,5-anhydro-D-fructose reductase [Rubripirellula lacrimiformis]
MKPSPTRFGIIGTGRITRRLVADLQSTDGVEVTVIASRSGERARWYGDQYGIGTAVEGYAELLGRDDIDAVYISLPPSLHAEWSIASAQAGKHLLCEKPLTVSPTETDEVTAACRKAGVRWLDATGWLHHPRSDAFRSWIDDGRFGKIGHISASVSFYQPFQSGDHRLDASLGGGCILDLGWYAGGLARFAAGQMPTAVQADAVMVDGVSQRLTAMMWFPGGITATISCGYDTATRKWFEVAGSDSSLICDDFTRPWPDKPARCWIHDAAGKVDSESFDGHQERSMITRLIGDGPLELFQQQAIDTQRILDLFQRSIDENGQRIEA